jgi:hypothetical protein
MSSFLFLFVAGLLRYLRASETRFS